jgi:hypothetical protein
VWSPSINRKSSRFRIERFFYLFERYGPVRIRPDELHALLRSCEPAIVGHPPGAITTSNWSPFLQIKTDDAGVSAAQRQKTNSVPPSAVPISIKAWGCRSLTIFARRIISERFCNGLTATFAMTRSTICSVDELFGSLSAARTKRAVRAKSETCFSLRAAMPRKPSRFTTRMAEATAPFANLSMPPILAFCVLGPKPAILLLAPRQRIFGRSVHVADAGDAARDD